MGNKGKALIPGPIAAMGARVGGGCGVSHMGVMRCDEVEERMRGRGGSLDQVGLEDCTRGLAPMR